MQEDLPVSTAKETMTRIIEQQPEDSSYDELLRELAVARMVERGLSDSDAGRTATNDEARRRIASWHK
jgi:predicted transcriptional regulator